MRLMEGTALGFDQIIFDQSSLLPIFFVFFLAFPVRPQKVKSVDMQWLVDVGHPFHSLLDIEASWLFASEGFTPGGSAAVAMISASHKDAELCSRAPPGPTEHRPASHKLSETGSDDNHKMTCGTVKRSGQYSDVLMMMQVEIIVEDVNDHAPQFPNPVWQLAFSEGSVPGTRYVRAR